jgi:hypothetical protein
MLKIIFQYCFLLNDFVRFPSFSQQSEGKKNKKKELEEEEEEEEEWGPMTQNVYHQELLLLM